MRTFSCLLLAAQATFCSAQTIGDQARLDSLNRVIHAAAHDTAVAHAYLGLTEILQVAHLDTIAPLCHAAKAIVERNLVRSDLSTAELVSFKRTFAGLSNYLGNMDLYSGRASAAGSEYRRSLMIARELTDTILIGEALGNVGNAILSAGYTDSALKYLDSAIRLHEKINYQPGLVVAKSNRAYAYKTQGRIALAMRQFTELMKQQRALGDDAGIANSWLNIGDMQQTLLNDRAAIEAYEHSLAIAEELHDEYSTAITCSNLGIVHGRQGDFEQAIAYLNRALAIQTVGGFRVDAGISHENLGIVYGKMGNTDKALEELLESVEPFRENGVDQNLANSLSSIGTLHLRAGRITEAEKYGRESLMLAKKVNLPWEIAGAAELLSKVYQRKNAWKAALEMELLLKTMQDSLVNDKNKTAATETRYLIKYEQMAFADSLKHSEEAKVAAARIMAQEAQLESERTQRNALFGGLALAVGSGAIIFERFRKTRRQKREIDRQKRKVEELMNTRSSMVRAISHSIRNPLNIFSNDVGTIAEEAVPETRESRRARRMTSGVDQMKRRLDFLDAVAQLEQGNMRLKREPVEFAQKLEALLDNYSPKIEQKGMVLETDIRAREKTAQLDWSQMEMVIENLLDNAIKYNPKGTTVRVMLDQEDAAPGQGNMVLVVSDTGRGINADDLMRLKQFGYRGRQRADEAAVEGTGIGLFHVDQVVALHGGKLDITSTEGQGSEFRISLPL